MSEYLRTYQIRLKTVGPVFVGNGKQLGKKEYIFLDRKHVGILDIEKFYLYVQKNRLEHDFETFMLKNSREDLIQWVVEHRIPMDMIKDNMKYILDSGDTALERGTPLQIMECVKDAYGCPYIPGSSLKGMLRTLLLSCDILENDSAYRKEKRDFEQALGIKKPRTKYLAREADNIEGHFYRTLRRKEERPFDVVNDTMAGVIISDSKPLSVQNLILCQKIEKHVDGQEKRLNLLRECVCPETEICFDITIDSTLSDLTIEHIRHAVRVFADNYYEKFKSAFPNVDRPLDQEVYLGGGCGFVSKTVVNAFFNGRENIEVTKKIFEQTGVPAMHKHARDLQYGVSPHILKCTRYRGKLLEMGLCRFEIG